MTTEFFLFDKWGIAIPEGLSETTPQEVKEIYPSAAKRPKVVFTNENQTVTLGFNLTEDKIRSDQLEEFRTNVFEPQFRHPNIEILRSEVQAINGIDFILFSFIAPNVHYKLYNSFFITSCEGKLFLGTFSCPANEMKDWKKTETVIIHSLKLISNKF